MANSSPSLRWTRLISPQWEDAWLERLAWIGRDRLCAVQLAGQKRVRVEAYPATEAIAQRLVADFGGKLSRLRAATWLASSRPSAPLRIGKKMWIIEEASLREEVLRRSPEAQILCVPASMAFGTGGHATTGMLARRLADIHYAEQNVLDVGTGSGLLALIARAGGAARVEAFDFDPVAVRIARENERTNFPGPSRIRWSRKDVTRWTPEKTYAVVLANLYGELLLRVTQPLTAAVRPGGLLLLSGILNRLETYVTTAFEEQGFRLSLRRRKGKWVMLEFIAPHHFQEDSV